MPAREAGRVIERLCRALADLNQALYWPDETGIRADRGDPCGDTTPPPPGSVT